jgi:ribonucleoside-diphosphate reductase alpha chain
LPYLNMKRALVSNMINKKKVVVDYSRDDLFDPMGIRRLRDSYMLETEKSPQDRFSYVARMFASDEHHAQRIYDYVSKHWLSLSTPVLSFGTTKKGLPISCYLAYVDDSSEGLVNTQSEVAWLSMMGGGVGLGFGLRAEDNRSVGIMPHAKVYEAMSLAYRQGKTRRGSFAAYLDISHPNIKQFIDMRKPTGDANQRCLELHHGINVTDRFMRVIEACMKDPDYDDSWELIDPHSKKVKEVVSAKALWESILETRHRTGEPYIHFIDASNRSLPAYQKALGLEVKQSNICTEITLATDKSRTAVCCLASLNVEYWDEWKDNYQFYRDTAEFLDNVLTYFIKHAPKSIERARFSAMRERAIGIGCLGFHALLQSKGIALESASASAINRMIFKRYKQYLDLASQELALERGSCPDAAEAGLLERFSHKSAIAPNASTSIIFGNTSPGTEPFRANAYRQDTLSGSYLQKNRYLDKIIAANVSSREEYDSIWSSIVASAGSVQHLPDHILSEHDKLVYKTATEIDQAWLVQHASDRAPFISQGQSLNLFFKADVDIGYLHHVHYLVWKGGNKTAYYCRSDKLYHGESEHAVASELTFTFDKTTEEGCLACE